MDLIHTKLDYILDEIHDRRERSERGSSNVFNFEPIKDVATLNEFERQLEETNLKNFLSCLSSDLLQV